MKNFIIFNGQSLRDFGVYISGLNTYNAPSRDVDSVKVPGRNGTLTMDNGRYNNINVTYPAFICNNYDARVEALRNFLLSQSGYKRLEDTYHPEEFRLARWAGEFTADTLDALIAGQFDLTFDCYPQRFLKEGEKQIELTANGSVKNIYSQTALPLIRAYGTGSFSINGISVAISSALTYTDIDCELQECYKDSLSTNRNAYVTLTNGEFPKLSPGANAVTLSGISKLIITPRFWIL
ncbi:MAG: hypothetical protein IKE92_05775 [Clostridiales bacterium]|nr:hypothetical protein [Clostridiales bacterium]